MIPGNDCTFILIIILYIYIYIYIYISSLICQNPTCVNTLTVTVCSYWACPLLKPALQKRPAPIKSSLVVWERKLSALPQARGEKRACVGPGGEWMDPSITVVFVVTRP